MSVKIPQHKNYIYIPKVWFPAERKTVYLTTIKTDWTKQNYKATGQNMDPLISNLWTNKNSKAVAKYQNVCFDIVHVHV